MSALTEAEAKTNWCPMVRQSATFTDGYGLSYNRSAMEATYPCRCIASECMMWRWAMKRNPDWKPTHSMMATGYDTHPDDQVHTHIVDTERGYCGLAGRL